MISEEHVTAGRACGLFDAGALSRVRQNINGNLVFFFEFAHSVFTPIIKEVVCLRLM
jgi:hypothetical protein